MFLQDQGIYDNVGDVGGGRRALELSNNDGGVGGGRGIDDLSEGLETLTEAAGDQRWDQGIYDDNRGVDIGR